ncbi:MAG TPA: hypothetical protein VF342_11670 [Alphaproteobacteria bacterium]
MPAAGFSGGTTESTMAWSCTPADWTLSVTVLPGGSGTVVFMPTIPAPVCNMVMPLLSRFTTVPLRRLPTARLRSAAGSCARRAATGPAGRPAVSPLDGPTMRVMLQSPGDRIDVRVPA